MKSRLTTIFKIWIFGTLASLALVSPLQGQPPVELFELQSENSVMGPPGPLCITAPVIACPSIYFGCPGDETAPSNTGFATATPGDENCENPIVSYEDEIISEGPCSGAIEIHRLWTAVYPNDSNPYLYSDCTQLIILKDDDGPTISNCPSDIEASPNANCEAEVSWTIPIASDNCGLEGFTSNYNSGDTFSLGTTTIIYTAVDSCGNESTCSFDIVVTGICCFEPPLLTCPEDFLGCPSTGSDPSITGQATAESSGDFCGEPTLAYSDNVLSSGPCDDEEVIERMWTATYESNPTLISSCIQTITLADTKAPLITNCPSDITVAPNENCQATVSWTLPVATDNCGLPSLSSNYESGSTFEEGENTVIYTAIDNCGNESTCSFIVTVSLCCDAPPLITCPEDYVGCPGTDIDVAPDSNFSITGIATAESAGIGCGDPLITYTDQVISEGPCEGVFEIERTWTATDSEHTELFSTCVQSITLVDNSNPVIQDIPQDITLAPDTDCSAVATWESPTANDNCGVESFSFTHQSGDEFEEGVTTVTYTAIDGCGNSTYASFTVTVSECCTGVPIITCPQDFSDCPGTSINPDYTGQASAVAGSEFCDTPIITYSDNVISSGPCAGAKHVIRTWTATDPNNDALFSICEQTIILEDITPPEVFNCPMDITVTTSGTSAIVTWVEPTADDNCSLEWIMGDHLPGESFPLGTTLVTYTAIDDCENVTPCTFVITVESEGTITCPDDIVVPCAGSSGTVVTWDLPVIETSCTSCESGDSIPGFIYMGSLDGSLYYCSTSPAASSSATNIAASNGGHLAVITSQEENDLLSGFLVNQCALIGLSDYTSEGNFQWANGEPLEYTNWSYGQPNNDSGNQDCVVLCTDGWNDSHCEIAYEFIMEIPCTTYEQTSGPTNGSVFSVGTEIITYVVTDACGTTLTCSFTVTVEEGVSLDCPDDITIGCPNGQSGVQAYWQVPELTTCCSDCSAIPDSIAGFMYMGSFGGSKYFCSLANASWPIANSNAKANGGYLAEINNAEENAFLANILTIQKAWIGLNDANQEGSFVWSNNNPLTYSNWYPDQPNNKNNYQDYVAMLSNGLWNDEYNNLAMEYIMEIPCTSVTQIGGPWNGSILPIGTSTITYAGMDGCGNTDTCSFDITVSTPGTCQSYGVDSWYMWIENIGLGTYSNVSGNNGGYADFTNEDCVEVESGGIYPIKLTPGFAGNLYTVYWKVWIDYNQDGDYFDAGEYVAYGNGYQQLNGNIPISSTCLLGETTMRISMKYGSYPSGPCAIFSNGEVEDYCIDISGVGTNSNGFTSNGKAILLSQDEALSSMKVANDLPFGEYENGIMKRESINILPSLKVFPNPANSILNLQMDVKGVVDFTIYNSEGKTVSNLKADFRTGETTLDVNHLQNGIYLLRSDDGRFSKKILIQR